LQGVNRAERYRKEANKYAELARSVQPDFLSDFYRKTAVRYVLMAEDVERWAEAQRRPGAQDRQSLWDRADDFLTDERSR